MKKVQEKRLMINRNGDWELITAFTNMEAIDNVCKSILDEVDAVNAWVA